MTTLMLYASAFFLGFLIVVVVALAYAIMSNEPTEKDETQSAH
jgi:hypothetical protein